MSKLTSTRESVTFACWPPEPVERLVRTINSAPGISTCSLTYNGSVIGVDDQGKFGASDAFALLGRPSNRDSRRKTMSTQDGASVTAWSGDCTIATDRPSAHDFAMLEELGFVRREAQAEANLAYEDWRCLPSGDGYAVYRAAQDRADAAQDDLALLTNLVAA
jgi:hypothetical protein